MDVLAAARAQMGLSPGFHMILAAGIAMPVLMLMAEGLWLRTGQHAIHNKRVSILDITPTIYDLMGVRGMIDEDAIRGASQVPQFRPGIQAERRKVA